MHTQWDNLSVLSLFQNFYICDDVTPANVVDIVETALMIALEETYLTAVGDQSLRGLDEIGIQWHLPPAICAMPLKYQLRWTGQVS